MNRYIVTYFRAGEIAPRQSIAFARNLSGAIACVVTMDLAACGKPAPIIYRVQDLAQLGYSTFKVALANEYSSHVQKLN